MEAAQALAASAAFMSHLVQSHDGLFYHVSKGKVQEQGMTTAEIVNANGPVRVAVEGTVPGDEPAVHSPAADVLIVLETKLELFTLNAICGFRRAYSSPTASSVMYTDVLSGRSEFIARAVYFGNASAARSSKVLKFFLDFAQNAHCSFGDVVTRWFQKFL